MKTRNPYANTKKRRAALAFLKSRNITQPRPIYPVANGVRARAERLLRAVK